MNGRARILVVEDEVVVSMDIQNRLRGLGYAVAGSADTAAGAVEAAGRLGPDLILMDIRLKGVVDGIAAAQEVRRRFEIPVVFLTAHADEGSLERAKQSEPFGYILKPFEDRELRTVLEMALYKQRADLEIRRLNRLYDVLSRVNRALVGVQSVSEFLEEVCRVAVETGRFGFAWVGRHRLASGVLETVGVWGRGAAGVELAPELVQDRAPGCPSFDAFREGNRKVGAIPDGPGAVNPCCRAARELGLREVVAVPVRVGGDLWGVFSVYSAGQGVFGPREVALLEEVAASIGFGLEHRGREEERVRAEQDLRHREAELAAIHHSAPFMMCLVERQGRIVRANRALERLGEMDPGAAGVGVPSSLVRCLAGLGGEPGTAADRVLLEAVQSTFDTGVGRQAVEAVLAPAGAGEVHVSASTALIEVGSTPLVLLCLEDITQRRRLKAQFLQAQKMEAVGQLAGGIAHDFNNILAAMLMNLGLMRNPMGFEGEPGEALTELERLAQRAADLTRQLLLFGRRQVLQVARIDMNEILAGLTRMLRRLLGEDIEVTLSCAPGSMWVDVDPGMLEQVVVNLVLNARDAMPQGGRLLIGTSRVRVAATDGGQRPPGRSGWFVCLRIADSGCGMTSEVRARIFEPFFTTKETGRGTGLGLPTVQGIVEQHRGWIEVESEVGRGSTFIACFPAAAGPPRPEGGGDSAGGAKVAVRGGTETILLVEDASAVRRMVAMTLRSFGYQVIETTHGQEAWERWLQDPGSIDLVLTDMVMPGGMTGLQLIEKLRKQRPDLRAVVSSGYNVDLNGPGEPSPEGVAYLAKPYRGEALAKAVRNCLDGIRS